MRVSVGGAAGLRRRLVEKEFQCGPDLASGWTLHHRVRTLRTESGERPKLGISVLHALNMAGEEVVHNDCLWSPLTSLVYSYSVYPISPAGMGLKQTGGGPHSVAWSTNGGVKTLGREREREGRLSTAMQGLGGGRAVDRRATRVADGLKTLVQRPSSPKTQWRRCTTASSISSSRDVTGKNPSIPLLTIRVKLPLLDSGYPG